MPVYNPGTIQVPGVTPLPPGLIPGSAAWMKATQEQWSKLPPEVQNALHRNQMAAQAAALREKQRQDREKLMRENDAKRRGLLEQRRQAQELRARQIHDTREKQKALNLADSKRQLQRVAAAKKQREQEQARMTVQRRNEAANRLKLQRETRQKYAQNVRNRAISMANERRLKNEQAGARKRTNIQQSKIGRNAALDYFNQQGVSGGQYLGNINAAINRIMGGLDRTQTATPQTFANVGEDVYGSLLERGRNAALGKLAQPFATGFENQLIPDTATKSAIDAIQQEHFGDAQEYIDNLLKRQVITQPGYDKALANLKGQMGTVNLQLQDIGKDVVAGGRQDLTNVANTARTAASGLNLGQPFVPTTYTNQLSQALQRFNQNLPAAIKTQVQGPLFDTSKLANIAGKATGAQNTAFDPYALNNTARPQLPQFDQSVMRSVF